MTSRITNSILYRQSLQDIRRNLFGSSKLQTDIASGVRIHRPSDDPAGLLRLLPLQNELRGIDQSLENISVVRENLSVATAALEDASEIMQRVRELTIQGANGPVSERDRNSLAEEIDQLISRMALAANSSRAGRYVFGGSETDSPPFTVERDEESTRVTYNGNERTVKIEVAPQVETELNLPGSQVFLSHNRGATTYEGETGITAGAGIDTGTGSDRLDVAFAGLDVPGAIAGIAQGSGETTAVGLMNYTFTAPDQISINGGPPTVVTSGENSIAVGSNPTDQISLSLTLPITPATGTFTSRATLSLDGGETTTEVDFGGDPNVRVVDGVDGSAANVDVSGLARTGQERVRYEGTYDAFSTLVSIRDILMNEAGEPQATVSSRLTESLKDVDESHESILTALRDLGFRSQNVDLLSNRVTGIGFETEASISQLRDTDFIEAITDFNQQDTLYQASLQVSARVVQVSLLNYLR